MFSFDSDEAEETVKPVKLKRTSEAIASTDSDSDLPIRPTRRKLIRKDSIKVRRMTRSMTSDPEYFSLESEHTSDAEEIEVNNQKPKKTKRKSKPIDDSPEEELIDVFSEGSESSSSLVTSRTLYCYFCGTKQPIDNFSANEQKNPKFGWNKSVCLYHRHNSGIAYDDQQVDTRKWQNAVEDIESKYQNVNDDSDDAIYVWDKDESSNDTDEPVIID